MIPTNRLRFVFRTTPVPGSDPEVGFRGKFLQQWWSIDYGHVDGEWRDVPLEDEEGEQK